MEIQVVRESCVGGVELVSQACEQQILVHLHSGVWPRCPGEGNPLKVVPD